MVYSNIVTATKPSLNIKEEILSFLKISPVPLTASELRIKLRNLSLKLPEYEILSELRSLQEEGLVRIKGGSWKPTSVFAKKPIPFQRIKPEDSPNLSIPAVPLPDEWTPSKSRILNPLFQPEPPPKPVEPLPPDEPGFSGPWGMFRKLLGYYSDCVRNDEGCEASGFLQDYGERFLFLNQAGFWYPRAGYKWGLTLSLGPDLQHFIKKLLLAGENGVLVLGYPFQIFSKPNGTGPEGVFVKPVFTYQLKFELQPNALQLRDDDPWPEINLDWLSYALKKPDQQKMFLSTCGLMDRGRIDESFSDGSQYTYAPDLKTLAAGVSTFFGERIKEPLRPECVSYSKLPIRPDSGIYNRAILMIGNRTRYTKSLLKEFKVIASMSDCDLDKTALKFIFKNQDKIQDMTNSGKARTSDEKTVHEGIVIDTCPLNNEQRETVASLLTEDVSVITGPPGTGKSQVVTAAMVNARLSDKTALFASRNHKAIDSVVFRLVSNDNRSLVVRANSKEDPFLKTGFVDVLSKLLLDEYDETAGDRLKIVISELFRLLEKRGALGVQTNNVQELKDSLGLLQQQMSDLAESWPSEAGLELAKMPQLFPGKLLEKLDSVIGPLRKIKNAPGFLSSLIWWMKCLLINPKIKTIKNRLQQHFPNWHLDISAKGFQGLKEAANQLPLFLEAGTFCSLQMDSTPIETKLQRVPAIEELAPRISKISNKLAEMSQEAICLNLSRWAGLPRDADREELAALKSALRGLGHPVSDEADKKTAQEALNKSLPFLLKHFPLWAVTNLSIGSRIPLMPGLYDLAILDEASQCDIPSAIPIIFRAKRVGVVGDPHQLSHTTRLSRTKDALLRKRHGLVKLEEQRFSYPDNSLYELFAQTNNIKPVLLRETYRSVESIADYSNRNFYGGRLRVATMADRLKIPRNTTPGIHWTEVMSAIKSGGSSGCFAPQEIEKVLDVVREILVQNRFEGTLGVVTPFRQQANRIKDRIYEEISVEAIRTANLIIDTAHGFQGDERDVMILSLCAGPDMPRGSRAFLRETANLINVSVSRARAVLNIVGNKRWTAQSGIPHLESLALPPEKFPKNNNLMKSPWHPHESPWEKVLYDALMARGVQTIPQYPALGRRLDLALVKKEANRLKIDIEVDGDRYHRNPDGSRKRDDVWRDIQLQGAGWRVMRFWVYQLREDLDKCVDKILKVWSSYD
ncbi:MAG: DUF559 domain-containing protein [Desulfosarcina sp.]|nr:DUF559 domain-containing protein [Desulfobacterales bacterium]